MTRSLRTSPSYLPTSNNQWLENYIGTFHLGYPLSLGQRQQNMPANFQESTQYTDVNICHGDSTTQTISIFPTAGMETFLLTEAAVLLTALQQFVTKSASNKKSMCTLLTQWISSENQHVNCDILARHNCFFNCHVMTFWNLIGAANILQTEVKQFELASITRLFLPVYKPVWKWDQTPRSTFSPHTHSDYSAKVCVDEAAPQPPQPASCQVLLTMALSSLSHTNWES